MNEMINHNRKIYVVTSTDNRFTIPTYVMIHSMMHNAKLCDEYEVIILIDKSFEDINKNILRQITDEFRNIVVSFLVMDDEKVNIQTGNKRFPPASYYRLALSSLLPEINKCLYIDGDTIICSDVSEIFDINLADNYVAGVADEWINSRNIEYDIVPEPEGYINSGVLLFNLEQMRRDNIEQAFSQLYDKKIMYPDQDIINVCCKNKKIRLPLSCNVTPFKRFTNFVSKKYIVRGAKNYTHYELVKACENPIIIHYAGPIKPWGCKWMLRGDVWTKYVSKWINWDIRKQYIIPFCKSNKVGFRIRLKKWAQYVLYRAKIYKIWLKLKKKI